jgi:hypothetical protein
VGAEFPLAYGGKICNVLYVRRLYGILIMGVGSSWVCLVAFSLSAVGSTAKYPYSLST